MTTNLLASILEQRQALRSRLNRLRLALLRLHKALLNFERVTYERFHGRVESSGKLLQLVIQHGWFDWLHPVSELVVQIDELLSADEPITAIAVDNLIDQTRLLLNPSETGNSFEQQYYNALQQDVDAVLAHAEVSALLAADR